MPYKIQNVPCAGMVPWLLPGGWWCLRSVGLTGNDVNRRWKKPSGESGFRNKLFLKSCSLFFRLASVSFQHSQHAGYQAKDGITEK
ncbi:hypothetical protein OOJ09_23705 [Mesorhizobium qingshengii]|uniref:Secreted protein n=1 Tax=Mesorhizobium qingshengii TaxID=1165689 RepID=A0ABT4R040_9HYPH|nr:hypothetical protein [Mesorhizobium qingshengii]MCZ8547207.1 hypothetical protein [Mesorhizobium qingshengii]